MIGVLGDQHLRDQRLGGNAALDDPRRCGRLHDCALASATAVARPAGDQDAEGGRHHVEALGNILADLVECAAAAGAGPDTLDFFDIDNLFDPLEVGRQRTTVGLARPLGKSPARLVPRMLSLGQGRLDFLQGKLELIGIELLGAAAEPVALEGLNDRLQAIDFCPEDHERIELAGLFEDERAKRCNVVGNVRFHEHEWQ